MSEDFDVVICDGDVFLGECYGISEKVFSYSRVEFTHIKFYEVFVLFIFSFIEPVYYFISACPFG
jgi:hypothetical protein